MQLRSCVGGDCGWTCSDTKFRRRDASRTLRCARLAGELEPHQGWMLDPSELDKVASAYRALSTATRLKTQTKGWPFAVFGHGWRHFERPAQAVLILPLYTRSFQTHARRD